MSSTQRGVFIFSGSDNIIEDSIINGSLTSGIRIQGLTSTNNSFVRVSVSNSSGSDLIIGTAGLNGTIFNQTPIGIYNFTDSGSRITIVEDGEGMVDFTQEINGSGMNLSSDVQSFQNSYYH
jgi:hypothetical protein